MPISNFDRKERLLDGLKSSRANQTINDLDAIAGKFGCIYKTTTNNENRIYFAPYKDISMSMVIVAIPHSKHVKKKYVSKFIHMCEDIIEKELSERR